MNSALYVRRFSLNLIRDLIGNQCSGLSRGLNSENLLDLVTILGQGNSVHAANLFYIFRNNRTATKYSSEGRRLLTGALAREIAV